MSSSTQIPYADMPLHVEHVPPPARPSFWTDLRRRWGVVAAITAVFLVLAVVLAYLRDPVYTAQARLNVGRVDVSTQAVPGFVEASTSLASSYSRAVSAEGVIRPVAQQVGLTPDQVRDRVSASPIVDSPVFVVEAKGPSADAAVGLANASTSALQNYVTSLNRSNPDSQRLLREYKAASLQLGKLQHQRDVLRNSIGSSATTGQRAELDSIEANIDSARLQQQTYSSLYESSLQGQASTDNMQVLSSATSASSDRFAVLQRLLFVGLLAGLVVGALIVLRLRETTSRIRRA